MDAGDTGSSWSPVQRRVSGTHAFREGGLSSVDCFIALSILCFLTVGRSALIWGRRSWCAARTAAEHASNAGGMLWAPLHSPLQTENYKWIVCGFVILSVVGHRDETCAERSPLTLRTLGWRELCLSLTRRSSPRLLLSREACALLPAAPVPGAKAAVLVPGCGSGARHRRRRSGIINIEEFLQSKK